MHLPDFLIIGAPKAGSSALHGALARHPELFLTTPKEPKFFLCGGRPPDMASQRGPGDAHSAREWVWSYPRYQELFAGAPAGTVRGESTPFYLWDAAAHTRIRTLVPEAKLIAVVRDPVDRAYSNWAHLWCDGLETERDFLAACGREPERVLAGYAPFWRYLELGQYGEQLARLYENFRREQVLVVRYRRLIDEPAATLDEICGFLGVRTGVVKTVPHENVSTWVEPTRVNQALRSGVATGAALGRFAPPRVWRQASRPLLAALHRGGGVRPRLTEEQRARLLPHFATDIALLSELTGEDFTDWLSDRSRGAFVERRQAQLGA